MTAPPGVVFAVPSSHRAETVRAKTITALTRLGTDPGMITVFVAPEERDEYARALEGSGVALRSGAAGLAANRAAIHRAYPEGALLVQADDDLEDIKRVTEPRSQAASITPRGFDELIREGFAIMQMAGARLWGIYPVANGYFMGSGVRLDLRYIIGCFWGCRNEHTGPLIVETDDKEDFERTLACYVADGCLVRIESVAPVTRYFTEPGGLQARRDGTPRTQEERTTESEPIVKALAARYPMLCKTFRARDGRLELRLRDQRKKAAR